MIKLTKQKEGWLVLCLAVALLLAFALPAMAVPLAVSFPTDMEPNFDADKVFFEDDSFVATLSVFGEDTTETRVAFGVVNQENEFVSAKVLNDCIALEDGVANFITYTPVMGQIILSGTIASDLPNGIIAVKFYQFVEGAWVDQTQTILQSIMGAGQSFLPLRSVDISAIVGLDSIFSALPDEEAGTGFWVTDGRDNAIISQLNDLYNSPANFSMVITDEDGNYDTLGDMTYGTIYFDALNFMDQTFMAALASLFENITMEQQDIESLDGFTLGLNTEQMTFLADMGATVSITSPYFENKDLTVESFAVAAASGDGQISDLEFSGDADGDSYVDTFEFTVDHFSDYDVDLTYTFSGTVYDNNVDELEGVEIKLLNRYLEEVADLDAVSTEVGSFEITGIPGGQYYVQFIKDGYIKELSCLWDMAVEGNKIDVDEYMDTLSTVTFTITDGLTDPIEGAQIVFNPGEGLNATTGPDGMVETQAVAGASYKVVKEGYKTVSATLGDPVTPQSKTLKKLAYLTLVAEKTHNIAFGEEVSFTAALKDADGVGIAGKTIDILPGGIVESIHVTTDENGENVFTMSVEDTVGGLYWTSLAFAGDTVYQAADSFWTATIVGVDAEPVPITTAEELADISDSDLSLAGNYILANDIDLAEFIEDNGGEWDTIYYFCGTFDGNGKKITGLSGYYPLFDDISAPAVIKDFDIEVSPGLYEDDFDSSGIFAYYIGSEDEGPIWIENINISGSTYNDCCGTPAGFATGVYGKATIKNCHVNVNIATEIHYDYYFGGFIGFSGGQGSDTSSNTDILIQNCSFTGSINGGDEDTPIESDEYATWGGFIGDNNIGSVIENCFADMKLYFETDGEDVRAGGFAGRNAGTIKGSYATGRLEFVNDYGEVEDTFAGGFVGRNVGSIKNCFANMDLDVTASAGATVGGFVGSNTAKSLENCYATGAITASAENQDDIYVGGVIGSAQVNSSFWNSTNGDFGYEPALFDNLDNTYYNDSLATVGIGAIYNYDDGELYLVRDRADEAVKKTAAQMKTATFADTLNDLQSPRVWNQLVSSRVNDGYPVLAWVRVATSTGGGGSLATYTVKFESNGGSQVQSISNVSSGATIDKPEDPTKEGYVFAGWYSDASFNAVFDFSSKITKNTTLYAKWTVAETPAGDSKYFSDVTEEGFSWAVSAIDALYEDGVIGGIGNGQYGPAQNIKRGDFILMLVRAFDLSAAGGDNFSDVPSGSYYEEALAIAKALGIAKGDGDSFMPQGALSRQDAMVLVYRVLQMKGKTLAAGSSADLAGFSDAADVADYAFDAISTLVKAGIMKGDGANLNPEATMTRAEMAVILYRLLQL